MPTFADLPDDLVLSIFARTTTEDLRSFRCVSSRYRGLVNCFIFDWKYGPVQPCFSPTKLLALCDFSRIYTSDFAGENCRKVFDNEAAKRVDPSLDDQLRLIGQWAGLLCVSCRSRFLFLLNPTTKDVAAIPLLPCRFRYGRIQAFGHDQLDNNGNACRPPVLICNNFVYDWSAGRWRELVLPAGLSYGIVPNFVSGGPGGIILASRIFWVRSIQNQLKILIYNILSDAFEVEDIPPGCEIVHGVAALNRLFSVFTFNPDGFDVWLRTEPGWVRYIHLSAIMVGQTLMEDGVLFLAVECGNFVLLGFRVSPNRTGSYRLLSRIDRIKIFNQLTGELRDFDARGEFLEELECVVDTLTFQETLLSPSALLSQLVLEGPQEQDEALRSPPHLQSYKAHKKRCKHHHISTKGMDPKFLRNQRYARKHNKKSSESAQQE